MTTIPGPTEYCRCQQPPHYKHLPTGAPDWYMQTRDALSRVLSAHLAVQARRKDPLKPPFPAKGAPEQLRPDEIAQREYFAACERAELARALRTLAHSADWGAVVTEVEAETETRRLEARELYDEYMATREVTR